MTDAPPILAYRIDYADGTCHHSVDGPPLRTTGVLAVVEWGPWPYRTLHYGRWDDPVAVIGGVELNGVTVGDAVWERYRLALHAEPHPFDAS